MVMRSGRDFRFLRTNPHRSMWPYLLTLSRTASVHIAPVEPLTAMRNAFLHGSRCFKYYYVMFRQLLSFSTSRWATADEAAIFMVVGFVGVLDCAGLALFWDSTIPLGSG